MSISYYMLKEGTLCRVYYNLNKHKLSIQTKTEKGWRVTHYSEYIFLKDVIFKVSEAGRQRVLKEQRKNVHAWVIGTYIKDFDINEKLTHSIVKYNPYILPYFYKDNYQKDRIESINYCMIDNKNIII